MKRLNLAAYGVAACLIGGLAACPPPPPPPEDEAFSPKCPEHLENWLAGDSAEGKEYTQLIGKITASGGLAAMPEVNDCQRLIFADGAGAKSYGPLGVLFASQSLGELFNPAVGDGAQYRVAAAATINTWEGSYPPLHLPAGWSCLYIVRRPRQFEAHPEVQRVRPSDTAARVQVMSKLLRTVAPKEVDTAMIRSELLSLWAGGDRPEPVYVYVAHVVPVNASADSTVSCPLTNSERLAEFPALAVSATPLATLVGTPGVDALGGFSAARWDADFGNGGRSQHISVRCGDAWCDVMPTDAAGPVPDLRPGDLPSTAKVDLKGWYDQQFLSVPDPAHPGRLVPGSTLATYLPHRELGGLTDPDFDGWRVVGYIHLNEASPTYKEKLNLEAGWNRVSLHRGELPEGVQATRGCRGAAQGSKDGEKHKLDPWWVKVEAPAGGASYFCSYRQTHPGPAQDLPGIVRWRWLDDDETTWTRCPGGCCPS